VVGRWDIHPAGVKGVLGRTEGAAGEFEGQMKKFNSGLQGAVTQCSSDIVASAISGFAEAQKSSIEFVFTRTAACMNAAAQATNAYLQGDLEMAANAQASATAAPDARSDLPHGPRGGAVAR
jgi:hypothetical protein